LAEEEFTYKNLRNVHQIEKKFAPLSEIEPSFYAKARHYIERLEKLKDGIPPSQQKIIDNEIKNAKQTLERIYELRERKIVLAALSKVRGGNPDAKKFLPEEKQLFDEMVKMLLASRNRIMFGKKENDRNNEIFIANKTDEESPRYVALIREDIPTFVGTDMKKYSLRKNDVVSLQKEIYEALKKRGVGEEINI